MKRLTGKIVIDNGGGIQVINQELEIVYSKEVNVFGTKSLTTDKFIDSQ